MLPPHAVPAAIADQSVAFDLTRYRDRKRVLVLFAPAATDTAFTAENAALGARASGLAERDLVVVRVLGAGESSVDGHPLAAADAAALRRRLGAPTERFTAVLVGKDGHVALRSHVPVVEARLFPLIDAMPMRRAEMARQAGARGREKAPER